MENKLGKLIDELDEKTLRDIHKNLADEGVYEGLITLDQIEDDPRRIREAMKLALRSKDVSIFEFVPQILKNEAELVRKHAKTPELVQSMEAARAPLDENSNSEANVLLGELAELAKDRNAQNHLNPESRDKFAEIVSTLIKVHKKTYTDIEACTGMTRQNVSRLLNQYQKKHIEPGPQLGKAANLADKGVKKTLEADLSKRASSITESYLNLGRMLFDEFEVAAMQKGFKIEALAVTAVRSYLGYGDLYAAMLKNEQQQDSMRAYIRQLEAAALRIHNENKKHKNTIRNMMKMRN